MRAWTRTLRHVWRRAIVADPRTVALITALTGVQSSVVAATGLGQRWLVDGAVTDDAAGVVLAVVVGAAAHGVVAAGGRVRVNAQLYLVGRTTAALQRDLLADSAAIPTTTHLEEPEYLDRLNLMQRAAPMLGALPWTVAGAVATSFSLLASMVLLALVHPTLAALALLAALPLLANRRAAAIVGRARDAAAQQYRREQRLHELCTDPAPAKEVLAAGAGSVLRERADEAWRAAATMEARAHARSALWLAAGWLVYAAGVGAALLIVHGLVLRGRASLGDAILVFTLATLLLAQLTQAADDYEGVVDGGRLARHHQWLTAYARDRARPGAAPPSRLAGGIALHGVSFRYPGRSEDALDGIDVHLPPGAAVALVGDNGAGKTTLARLLAGMYEPTAGQILVDGRPLRELDLAAWQGRISGVFQDFARFQFRAGEAIGAGDMDRMTDSEAVHHAAARSGALTVLRRLPHGTRTQLGATFGGTEPSTGQWQLLALARGLMRTEPLLSILDEPTAALDPDAEYRHFRTFADQTRAARERGAVTLLVSHRLATARLADRIIVLRAGRIVESGTHAELMASGGGYAELFRLQERTYQ